MFSYTPVYPQFPTYKEDETEANAKPVTQTIKTDPATGEQTMTISGSVQDLSAANPLTPTVTGPAVPQDLQPVGFAAQPVQMPELPVPGEPVQVAGPMQISAEEQRRRDGQRLQILNNELANTAARMEQTQDPAQRESLLADQAALQREIQNARRGMGMQPINFAQPAPSAPVAPSAPSAPMAPQQVAQVAPAPQVQLQVPQPQPAQAPSWFQSIQNIQGDTAGLAAYYGNKENPEEGRDFARTLLRDELARGQQQQSAQKTVDKAVATGDMLPLMREIKKSSEEGSYIKAYLYNRLGLKQLAAEEEQKLGAGAKWQTAISADGRSQALLQYDANGLPLKGYDQTGQALSSDDLAKFAIAGALPKGIQQGQTMYADPFGQVKGRFVLETRPGFAPVFKEISTGRLATPLEATRLNPTGVSGPLEQQLASAQQKAGVALQYAAPTAAATAGGRVAGETAATYGTPQPLPVPPVNMLPQGAQVPGTTAPAAMPAPAAATPAVPTQAATPQQRNDALRQAAGGAAMVSPVPAPGQTPAQLKSAQELATEQGRANIQLAKEVEADRQKDINEVKKALPTNESSAINILKTVDDVLTHPGYKDVVGMPSLSGMTNLYGTNARDFRAKYNQLMGQQFLAAFNQLRGGGAISEIEGTKAEQAIAALKDPNISEKEFKRNAEILKDTIRGGIDRQRVTVGFEPKYKPFNDEEKKAFAWAKSHASDPRAQEIINRLQNR